MMGTDQSETPAWTSSHDSDTADDLAASLVRDLLRRRRPAEGSPVRRFLA
jgi:hypothetical protein